MCIVVANMGFGLGHFLFQHKGPVETLHTFVSRADRCQTNIYTFLDSVLPKDVLYMLHNKSILMNVGSEIIQQAFNRNPRTKSILKKDEVKSIGTFNNR